MISPSVLKTKASKHYIGYLQTIIRGDNFFPLDLEFNRSFASLEYADLNEGMSKLVQTCKPHVSYGLTIDLKILKTRKFGLQSLPFRIYFESERDFILFLGKEDEVIKFKEIISTVKTEYQFFTDLLLSKLSILNKVLDHIEHMADILKVCDFFFKNPKPNMYLRELPIPVHTKFIEDNQSFLKQLLCEILPEESVNRDEKIFERMFFLKEHPTFIRIKFLDRNDLLTFGLSFNDFQIQISDFNQMDSLYGKKVLIIENLQSYLSLPPMENVLAVFGMGMGVAALKDAAWLNKCELFYWGDIDTQGFAILSVLRGFFSETTSLLMDDLTFEEFKIFRVKGTISSQSKLSNLTDEELKLYTLLYDGVLRLEQEKISTNYISNKFKEAGLLK